MQHATRNTRFKRLLFLFTLVIFLTSCEKDLYQLEEQGNSSKRVITFNQFDEIINRKGTADRKLNTLLTKSKLNHALSNRTEEGFIKQIDTSKVFEINIEGKTTYTMRVETNVEDGINFYNLLVYEKNDQLK